MRSAGVTRWLAIGAAVSVLVGCTNSGPTPTGSASAASVPAETAPPTVLPAAARIRLGHQPCGIVATPTRIWVSNYGDGTLQWIDPATNRPGPPIPVGASPCGLAVGAGSVWVENYGSNNVTRVDATTGKVQATIDVGSAPYDVTFAAGAAWVTDYSDGTVSRIDATTNRRTVIRTGGQPTGIVPAAGGLWVGLGGPATEAGATYTVIRIDSTSGAITDRLNVGRRPTWTASDGTNVWLSDAGNNTVIRVDGAARRAVDSQPLGASVPLDGDVAAGAVWIPDKGGRLYRIDPTSGKVTGRYGSGVGVPFVIAGSASTLWVVDYSGTDVVRLDLSTLP
jgi:YVTN family beta-propeller protein